LPGLNRGGVFPVNSVFDHQQRDVIELGQIAGMLADRQLDRVEDFLCRTPGFFPDDHIEPLLAE